MPRPPAPANWAELPDEELLNLHLASLPIQIAGTIVEARVAQLRAELEAREIRAPLHFYLSDEWFTPDGTVAIAVPFYLAHPRLEKLERAQMLEVEGGEHEWCMRILRHEAGHAIDNAYRLRRLRRRREVFGKSSEPYPEFYTPKPYSKSFVMHLDAWYAQSHPDEDFAETFALWLTPGSSWEQRYAGWPAIEKLEYVDTLMQSLRNAVPAVHNTDEMEPLRGSRRTLRQYYKRKRRHYGIEHPSFYDRDLRKLFSDAPEFSANITAVQFIGRVRQPTRRLVADWTGIYQYTIDRVIEDMSARCRQLNLRLAVPEEQARREFTMLLTVQTMNYLHSGRHRVAL